MAAPAGILTPSGVNTNVQTGSAGNGTIASTTTLPTPGTYDPKTGDSVPLAPNNPGYSGPVSEPGGPQPIPGEVPGTGSNSFTSATPSSPTATTSDAASTAVDGIGSGITDAAQNPPTAPTPGNPSGNPATAAPNSYLQYDGTYGPNPDPYGFGTPGYQPANDPRVAADANTANAPYVAQDAQLQQEEAAEVANLQGEEATDEATQSGTDAAAASNAELALGASSSGAPGSAAVQYMQTLANAHQQSMQTLQAKYQTQIQAAQDAFSDKDFAVAEAETKNAQDTKAAATAANTTYLDYVQKQAAQAETDSRDAADEANQQATQANNAQTQARDTINTVLTNFGGTTWDQLPPATQASLTQIEQAAGFPSGMLAQGLATIKQQQMQAQASQAAATLAARQSQDSIANSMREVALSISAQNAANNQATKTLTPDEVTSIFDNASSYGNTQYLTTDGSLANLTPDQQSVAKIAADNAGMPVLTATEHKVMDSITAGQGDLQSLDSMMTSMSKNPTTWYGRPLTAAQTTFQTYLQTNGQLDAFNSWKASALPILQALSTSGSSSGGGRSAAFLSNLQNSLPSLTDTMATAQAKIQVLQAMMDQGAQAMLGQKATVQIKDPKTGTVKSFSNMSADDLNSALQQGYTVVPFQP